MHNTKPINSQQSTQLGTPVIYRKTFLITILIFFALISGLWIWKAVENRSMQSENDRTNRLLRRKVSMQMDANLKAQLILLAKPLAWAIRDKMISGNRQDISVYMNQMVKEKNFEEISIVDQRNIILLSTDKKEEGKPYSIFYNSTFLRSDSARIYSQRGRSLVLTTPILDLNRRLGTLSISYHMPAYTVN